LWLSRHGPVRLGPDGRRGQGQAGKESAETGISPHGSSRAHARGNNCTTFLSGADLKALEDSDDFATLGAGVFCKSWLRSQRNHGKESKEAGAYADGNEERECASCSDLAVGWPAWGA
jgi:hypothetical protein